MHAYRVPGRAPDAPPAAALSARELLSPLACGGVCVGAALVPPLLFNVVVPLVMPNGASFVPTFDFVQDAIGVTMLASAIVVVACAWRHRLTLPKKIAYVLALVVVQLGVTAGAEGALLVSRGGLHMFEPSLASTTFAPDGRAAFVYRDDFLTCRYEVKSAEAWSLAMRPALSVSRASCNEPLPTVDFRPDGSVDLLGADGKHLEPQTSPNPLAGLFWHGC